MVQTQVFNRFFVSLIRHTQRQELVTPSETWQKLLTKYNHQLVYLSNFFQDQMHLCTNKDLFYVHKCMVGFSITCPDNNTTGFDVKFLVGSCLDYTKLVLPAMSPRVTLTGVLSKMLECLLNLLSDELNYRIYFHLEYRILAKTCSNNNTTDQSRDISKTRSVVGD